MKGTPHTRSGNIINVDDGETLLIHAGTTKQAEAIKVIAAKLRDRTTTNNKNIFHPTILKPFSTKSIPIFFYKL